MSKAVQNLRIDYIELPATDIAAAKRFYTTVFGWSFTDYGPDYSSFNDGQLDGGLTTGRPAAVGTGSLVIFYAIDLEAVEQAIIAAGGTISTPTFTFPGGRRFQFTDPSGNELAVWTDK